MKAFFPINQSKMSVIISSFPHSSLAFLVHLLIYRQHKQSFNSHFHLHLSHTTRVCVNFLGFISSTRQSSLRLHRVVSACKTLKWALKWILSFLCWLCMLFLIRIIRVSSLSSHQLFLFSSINIGRPGSLLWNSQAVERFQLRGDF